MFSNYFKVAIRALLKHKSYSLINITGLAVGLTGCVLILLYVFDELSFDRFHSNADRIFRAEYQLSTPSRSSDLKVTPSVVGPLMQREIPEIEKAVRIYNYTSYGPLTVRSDEHVFRERHFMFADSSVFEVFSFSFIQGDPATALSRPGTVVISESTAKKYFQNSNPVGRTINIRDARDYEITGIFKDLPHNSHLHIDFLASYTSLSASWATEESWSPSNFLTYFLLHNTSQRETVLQKAQAIVERETGRQAQAGGVTIRYLLRPLTEIHLHWEGNRAILYIFFSIAALILLIACFNYMNLATARAAQRNQEVGMRKVLGANRFQLARQFFGESALITFIALILAAGLIYGSLPFFNTLAGKQLTIDNILTPNILFSISGIGILAALLAGSYPALVLSSFQPLSMLKSGQKTTDGDSRLRKILVVCQFAVTMVLLVATSIVFDQLDFVRTKNLGFEKDQVVAVDVNDRNTYQNYPALKKALLQHSNILQASAASELPGDIRAGYIISARDIPDQQPRTIGYLTDEDIVETLGLNLLAGNGFRKPWREDTEPEYLVNEAALRALGWSPEQAIGREIGTRGEPNGRIVGVVQDFHFASLHSEIVPMVIWIEPRAFDFLMVKIGPGDVTATIDYIQQTWQRMMPASPLELTFLDQKFEALYLADLRIGHIFTAFATLALFVACLGLLGLASFTAEQRRKEIGVRKVLGASAQQVVWLLSRDFSKLVLLAFAVAVPFAWYAANRWLQSFAYRVEPSWSILLTAGAIIFFIALLTVSTQAYRAATLNPVDSLREQ